MSESIATQTLSGKSTQIRTARREWCRLTSIALPIPPVLLEASAVTQYDRERVSAAEDSEDDLFDPNSGYGTLGQVLLLCHRSSKLTVVPSPSVISQAFDRYNVFMQNQVLKDYLDDNMSACLRKEGITAKEWSAHGPREYSRHSC
jgi:hypothetical protein